jgi:hypothetical protein
MTRASPPLLPGPAQISTRAASLAEQAERELGRGLAGTLHEGRPCIRVPGFEFAQFGAAQ